MYESNFVFDVLERYEKKRKRYRFLALVITDRLSSFALSRTYVSIKNQKKTITHKRLTTATLYYAVPPVHVRLCVIGPWRKSYRTSSFSNTALFVGRPSRRSYGSGLLVFLLTFFDTVPEIGNHVHKPPGPSVSSADTTFSIQRHGGDSPCGFSLEKRDARGPFSPLVYRFFVPWLSDTREIGVQIIYIYISTPINTIIIWQLRDALEKPVRLNSSTNNNNYLVKKKKNTTKRLVI